VTAATKRPQEPSGYWGRFFFPSQSPSAAFYGRWSEGAAFLVAAPLWTLKKLGERSFGT
jgi:hypothetical protein